MENIPQDILDKAAEVAWQVSLSDADHLDRIAMIAAAIFAERERCAALVEYDWEEGAEIAAKIRLSP